MLDAKNHRFTCRGLNFFSSLFWYWELSLTTPRHGDRPFEIVHLDHIELDLELVCARTGRPLGRPWLTFLVDAFSRCQATLFIRTS